MEDLLASPAARLSSARILVVPLTCDLSSEKSTWRVVLARRFTALAPPSVDTARLVQQIITMERAQAGKPLGTIASFHLEQGHPLRRTGIIGLILVCASPDQAAQKEEIGEFARALMRRARDEAAAIGATQIAIPRIPFRLDSSQGSHDRGASLFWQLALANGRAGLNPADHLDIIFGLYALGDGGQRNREAFAAAAREALPDGAPAPSRIKIGVILGVSCFVAGCLAAWTKRRRATLTYLAGLWVLAATGAAGLLATFGLGDLSWMGLPPIAGFVIALVLMTGIGAFAERAARFDWRKPLGAEK
jgi:hypothetical protein